MAKAEGESYRVRFYAAQAHSYKCDAELYKNTLLECAEIFTDAEQLTDREEKLFKVLVDRLL